MPLIRATTISAGVRAGRERGQQQDETGAIDFALMDIILDGRRRCPSAAILSQNRPRVKRWGAASENMLEAPRRGRVSSDPRYEDQRTHPAQEPRPPAGRRGEVGRPSSQALARAVGSHLARHRRRHRGRHLRRDRHGGRRRLRRERRRARRDPLLRHHGDRVRLLRVLLRGVRRARAHRGKRLYVFVRDARRDDRLDRRLGSDARVRHRQRRRRHRMVGLLRPAPRRGSACTCRRGSPSIGAARIRRPAPRSQREGACPRIWLRRSRRGTPLR